MKLVQGIEEESENIEERCDDVRVQKMMMPKGFLICTVRSVIDFGEKEVEVAGPIEKRKKVLFLWWFGDRDIFICDRLVVCVGRVGVSRQG